MPRITTKSSSRNLLEVSNRQTNDPEEEPCVSSHVIVAEQQAYLRQLQQQVSVITQDLQLLQNHRQVYDENHNRGFEIISSVSASLGIRSGK
jgi:hypothetical protein